MSRRIRYELGEKDYKISVANKVFNFVNGKEIEKPHYAKSWKAVFHDCIGEFMKDINCSKAPQSAKFGTADCKIRRF